MSRNYFAIGCLHLFHENITKWETGRPEFKNAKEMNELILHNWNSVVKPGDRVYVLGDLFFGEVEQFQKLWPKFVGTKRLVLGNHDRYKNLAKGGFFDKIEVWFRFKELGFLMTHVPVHQQTLEKDNFVNIHAHTHRKGSPPGPYLSVSAELVNYTPVPFEELSLKRELLLPNVKP